ncbi:MAG: hypothetical protein QXX81_07375 [Zestosphaera sp.]
MRLAIVKRVKAYTLCDLLNSLSRGRLHVKSGRACIDLYYAGVPILSIGLGLLASAVIFQAVGVPPDLFIKEVGLGFMSPHTLRYSVLLIILGVALTTSFRASVWNVGAEGQMIWGMLAGGFVGLFIASRTMYVSPSELPSYLAMPGVEIIDQSPLRPVVSILQMSPAVGQLLMVLAAMVAGGLWALIPALLKAYVGIDEVAVSLILNYVAYQVFNHLVTYSISGLSVQAKRFFRTDRLNSALLFESLPGTTLTLQEVIMCLLFLALTLVMFKYTSVGLRLKVLGSNPQLLRSVGIDERKYILLAMLLSGMLAGAAGVSIFANPAVGKLEKIANVVTPPTLNLGYTAILVSWLSMLDPRLVPVYAYIVASLFQGGSLLQSEINARFQDLSLTGAALTYIPIGVILLVYVVMRVFVDYSVRLRR